MWSRLTAPTSSNKYDYTPTIATYAAAAFTSLTLVCMIEAYQALTNSLDISKNEVNKATQTHSNFFSTQTQEGTQTLFNSFDFTPTI